MANVNSDSAYNNYFDGIPLSRKQTVALVLILLSYGFDQMDNLNFGLIAKTLVTRGFMNSAHIDIVISTYMFGQLIGSLVGGYLSDIFGRKKSMMASVFLFSICSVFNGLATSPEMFIVFRFITGIGLLSTVTISIVYISEMTPGESRGKWLAIIMGCGAFAMPIIAFINQYLVSLKLENSWRYVLFIGGLGLVVFAFSFKYLKESPRWLVAKGRVAEAEAVILELTGREVDLSRAYESLGEKQAWGKQLKSIFSGQYLRRTIVLLTSFSIATSILMYTLNKLATLMPYNELETAGIMAVSILAFPLSGLLLGSFSDKGGRKIPIVFVSLAFGLLYLVCGTLFNFFSANLLLAKVFTFL